MRRGTLAELAAGAGDARGEVTVVVAGAVADAGREPGPSPADLAAEVGALVAAGESRRDAVDAVAARYRLPRRVVYTAATG